MARLSAIFLSVGVALLCLVVIDKAQALSVKALSRYQMRGLPRSGGVGVGGGGGEDNRVDADPVQKSPCYESIPCGWAHYTTDSNRFRPIYHYTKNTLCQCQREQRCVLTDNRVDRKAYIFQCRNAETSRHMYSFPDWT